ncbi:MAG: ABC transporter, partial [Actinomycetes bacterium]
EDVSVLDSAKLDQGVSFDADVDVTEWLGDELYAYIPFEADPSVQAKLEELDRDLDGEGMRTQLVVSLDAMSRVRDGSRARLWFDPRRMHLFDPEDGENLTRNEDEARRINEENERLRQESLARAQRADGNGAGPGSQGREPDRRTARRDDARSA